jgi:hypothetical protein
MVEFYKLLSVSNYRPTLRIPIGLDRIAELPLIFLRLTRSLGRILLAWPRTHFLPHFSSPNTGVVDISTVCDLTDREFPPAGNSKVSRYQFEEQHALGCTMRVLRSRRVGQRRRGGFKAENRLHMWPLTRYTVAVPICGLLNWSLSSVQKDPRASGMHAVC